MRDKKTILTATVVVVVALGLFLTFFAAACGDDLTVRGPSIERQGDQRASGDCDRQGPAKGLCLEDKVCDGSCEDCDQGSGLQCDGDCTGAQGDCDGDCLDETGDDAAAESTDL